MALTSRDPASLAPIGVFDSGVGGLSVWQAIAEVLPAENMIYLADQAHVPYGSRSVAEIEALTHRAGKWFVDQGVKMLVIACNTASAAALGSLRARWPDLAVVGMEPAVKPACERSRTGKVGVMATPGTLGAGRFASLVERFSNGAEVHTRVCPGLVELVEMGRLNDEEVVGRLQNCLGSLSTVGIDHLVLGCTHYPFLRAAIQQVMGDGVTLVDPAPAVARQVQRLLTTADLRVPAPSTPMYRFYTTGDRARFKAMLASLHIWQDADVQSATISGEVR